MHGGPRVPWLRLCASSPGSEVDVLFLEPQRGLGRACLRYPLLHRMSQGPLFRKVKDTEGPPGSAHSDTGHSQPREEGWALSVGLAAIPAWGGAPSPSAGAGGPPPRRVSYLSGRSLHTCCSGGSDCSQSLC